MADSLVLSGVKHIKKHTGTEMVRRFPKGGGDVFKLKRWWVEGGVNTVNTNATVFEVTASGGNKVKLAIESSVSTNLRIDHDGSFNFTFSGINEVGRAALFTDDWRIIEHYVFPKISGGKVMTVTPAGAAGKPGAGAAKTFTGVTLTGDNTADEGETKTYVPGSTGTATDVTYVLTSDGSNDTVSGMDVTYGDAGNRTLTLTGTSVEVGNQRSTTLSVTVSAVTPDVVVTIDSVNGTDGYILSGDATGENATINVTAGEVLSITNNTGSHPLYIKTALGSGNSGQINDGSVTGQGATNGAVVWDTDGVAAGTYYYQCQVHEPMAGEIVVA